MINKSAKPNMTIHFVCFLCDCAPVVDRSFGGKKNIFLETLKTSSKRGYIR